MNSYDMDQVIGSFMNQQEEDFEFNLTDLPIRPKPTTFSQPDPTCPRCGGPLYYNSCDCTFEPGPYGSGGEWTSGD